VVIREFEVRVVAFWIGSFWIIGIDAGVDGEWGIEEVPGFAVGIEAEHGCGRADFYGDDVPDVEFDYPSASLRTSVGGDEIDVALGVDGTAFAGGVGGASFVSAGAEGVGAFDPFGRYRSLRASFARGRGEHSAWGGCRG